MKSLMAAAAVFLCLPRFCAAEDWTTTDGKTYHDVKGQMHNNLEVTIRSREGNVTIALANLPPDLQKRFRYDAAREKAMDSYLIRVRLAPIVLGEPPDPARIRTYAAQLKQLLANPAALRAMPTRDIIWLLRNRVIVGGFLSYKMAPADAAALRDDEIRLIGLMLMALESKVDPALPDGRVYASEDTSPESEHASEQNGLKHDISDFIGGAKFYLKALFHHINDNVSIDDNVRPILISEGVDSTSIDWLLGEAKYTY